MKAKNITEKDIKKFRRMSAIRLHNAEWHDYMSTKKSMAIRMTFDCDVSEGDSIFDILKKAQENYIYILENY